MQVALEFVLAGTIADVDATVDGEPAHPSLVLIVETGAEFARIVVPPATWSQPRELLQIGRAVRVRRSLPRPSPDTLS